MLETKVLYNYFNADTFPLNTEILCGLAQGGGGGGLLISHVTLSEDL
jgi:hypothetical protein